MGEVIRFPAEKVDPAITLDEPGEILILPGVRIERTSGHVPFNFDPTGSSPRRRKSLLGGTA